MLHVQTSLLDCMSHTNDVGIICACQADDVPRAKVNIVMQQWLTERRLSLKTNAKMIAMTKSDPPRACCQQIFVPVRVRWADDVFYAPCSDHGSLLDISSNQTAYPSSNKELRHFLSLHSSFKRTSIHFCSSYYERRFLASARSRPMSQ